MSPAPGVRARWLSASIFLKWDIPVFLYEYLAPRLVAAKQRRRLKRFFFIRYSEGGEHIRVRAMPVSGFGWPEFHSELTAAIELFGRDGIRIERTVYDRTQAYFGETAASVWAELLNEQTSVLAWRLAEAGAADPVRVMLSTAAAIACLLEACSENEAVRRDLASAGRTFALRALMDLGWRPLPVSNGDGVRKALERRVPQLRGVLAGDPAARRLQRILRKMLNRNDLRYAGVHGLHLLCNKLGVTLPQEHHLYGVIEQLGR